MESPTDAQRRSHSERMRGVLPERSEGHTREARPPAPDATIRDVSVFKRVTPTHVHVRTPVMIGVIFLLVVVLSAVCYYRVGGV